MKPIIYFDIETTGTSSEAKITQLSAVAFEGDKELAAFDRRIKFDPSLADPEALEIQGYTAERWENAIEPLAAVRQFSAFIAPYRHIRLMSKRGRAYHVAQLAGFNALVFDGPKLRALYNEFGELLAARMQILDVYQLALWHYEDQGFYPLAGLKLTDICKREGIALDHAHDALYDARATGLLAHKILSKTE